MGNTIIEGQESLNISIYKPHWEKVEDGKYSEDHVINAYLSGKESALKEISDALSKQKIELLKKGMEYTDELLDELQETINVTFEKAFLRQIDFKNIDVVVVLPKDVYFSDKINKIYETTFKIEKKSQEDIELNISYSFDLENVDVVKLSNDGYIFSRES